MDPEDLPQDPDRPRPRPKVVDKRVSSRTSDPAEASQAPAPPGPARPEPTTVAPDQAARGPGVEPDQGAHGPTPAAASAGAASQEGGAASQEGAAASEQVWTPEQEERARQIAQEIAETPSFEWVVNTAVTLANVAGTKLDLGAVADAQLAIDALGGILDAVGGRLQGAEAPLRQTLAQLRLAYAERVPAPQPGQ